MIETAIKEAREIGGDVVGGIKSLDDEHMPAIVRIPAQVIGGVVRSVLALAGVVVVAAFGLMVAGQTAEGIYAVFKHGVELMGQARDIAQPNVVGRGLWLGVATIVGGVMVLSFKSKMLLKKIRFVWDWTRFHTGHTSDHPEVALLRRLANEHGFDVVKRQPKQS